MRKIYTHVPGEINALFVCVSKTTCSSAAELSVYLFALCVKGSC